MRELLSQLHASRELVFSSDKRALTPELRRKILDHFRADNEALHQGYFPHISFDAVFGPPRDEEDADIDFLRTRVDGLTDVVAIQMEVILGLLEKERETRAPRSLRGRVARLWRRDPDPGRGPRRRD